MKRIVIDMNGRTEHHTVSGSTYRIDRRLERRAGSILLERNYVHHSAIAGIRSLVLPEQHLWVIFFEGVGGPYECQCYMHMAQIHDQGSTVLIEDLYLDVVVMADGRWHLLDVNEFRAAIAAGELSDEQIQVALQGLESACRLVDTAGLGIEAHLLQALN